MFSGIVQELGKVISTESTESGFELGLEVELNFLKDLRKGNSIAINGVCLTVIRFTENKGYIIGLRAKGKAIKNKGTFVQSI